MVGYNIIGPIGPPDEVCLRCGTQDTSRQATQTIQETRSEPAHETVV